MPARRSETEVEVAAEPPAGHAGETSDDEDSSSPPPFVLLLLLRPLSSRPPPPFAPSAVAALRLSPITRLPCHRIAVGLQLSTQRFSNCETHCRLPLTTERLTAAPIPLWTHHPSL